MFGLAYNRFSLIATAVLVLFLVLFIASRLARRRKQR